MIDRRSRGLLVAIPVLVIIILAGSSFFSGAPRNPILIKGTPTPTSMNLAISPTPSPVFPLNSTRPSFTLMQNSNCHNGPGVSYDVVLDLQAGTSLDVIGRNLDNSWWRVAEGPSIDCWIPGDAGTFTGDPAAIPITSSRYATQAVTPPTPTKGKRTAEPTNAGASAPATAVPTDIPVQPTDTSPPVISTLPPIIDTVIAPTAAPTELPPTEQSQPLPPGQFNRPPTHTPQAP